MKSSVKNRQHKIGEDYIRYLSKNITELKFRLNQEEDFEVFRILNLKKQPITNRYILFEDTKDFAQYYLTIKNGKALSISKLIHYYY